MLFMNFVNSSSCSQYAGSSWDELKHIRQAVGFLVCPLCFYAKAFSTFLVLELTQSDTHLDLQVIHQKYRISYDEITNDLCPVSFSLLCVCVCVSPHT